ncbi:DUF2169 family type VI secretion system accessory protein [Pseudoduganella sp. OTU4001]|uniref:DUF2169 family type VI secretion system accessory protein n=1 Tax=Pseudoduganella sp. OTU4001 TaxID=3043854 RepID=UPI00313C131B
MELINATRMVAGYTMGMEPSGRELLVVVIKGTFHLPKEGQEAQLHEQQLPLVMADTFTGEPGKSAPYYEVDFATHKLRCDVLLQGSAYAPEGRPATRVPVGIRVGGWMKTFAVIGDRYWQTRIGGVSASAPQSFTVMPISYDNAFGGTDTHHEDPSRHDAFMRNPVGKGFHRHLRGEWLNGSPLPNTEELKRPIDSPDGEYIPMAFGPQGRGWSARLQYAGTYDQNWVDNVFPFLPADFNNLYYQAAPQDQQIEFPLGGEEVVLVNLTPDGNVRFKLPAIAVPVYFFGTRGALRNEVKAQLDTVALYPDSGVFTLTWRASLALERNIFEIPQVIAGTMSRGWWRARETGKQWRPKA